MCIQIDDWIGCASHNIALVQKYAFGENERKKGKKDPIESITKLIDSAKSLVAAVKSGGINTQLESRLKHQIDTRWDTNYDMLQSILDNLDQLRTISCIKDHMTGIKRNILVGLTGLLKPIKLLRIEMSYDDRPTFHLVSIVYDRAMELMKPDPSEDDSLIIVLKSRFKAALQDKFVVTPLHVIASFISPAFRSHQFSVKEIRDQAMSDIQKLVMEQDEGDNEDNIEEEHMPDSILSLYMDKPSSTISSDSEINRYKVFPITPDDIKMSPIDFWYRNRRAFPHLYRIAS